MKKRYMVWWHNYVNDIDSEDTTLKKIFESVSKALKDLGELKLLEEQGKIKVKKTQTLNPIFIEILDKSVELEVINNPIVDVDEIE
jgi:hypothetical protein